MPLVAPLPSEFLLVILFLRVLHSRRLRLQRLRRWVLLAHHAGFSRRLLFSRLAPIPTSEFLDALNLVDYQIGTVLAAHFLDIPASRISAFLGVATGV